MENTLTESTETIMEDPSEKPEKQSLTKAIEQLIGSLKEDKAHMEYIKPEMLPNIDLYMDQVTTFMDAHLQSTKRYADDKILTKTMINNYAKNNLLPPPEKKKYSKDHLLLLTFIYYLKSMLSMNDIQCVLQPLKDRYFHKEENGLTLEDIYNTIFSMEEKIQGDIIDDISENFQLSRQCFEDDPSLQNLTYICLLCYDIFLKKQLVEKIIDHAAKQSAEDASEKKKHK